MPSSLVIDLLQVHQVVEQMKAEEMEKATKKEVINMVSATAQMKQMQALTKAITEQTEQMQKVFSNLTNTLQGIEKAKRPLTEAEKVENVRAALERAEGAATGFDKRTQILNRAIKQSFIDGEKGLL